MDSSVSDKARKAGKARMAPLDYEQRKAFASSGGLARADALSKKQRSSIARKAAKTRWNLAKSVTNSDVLANVPASV